jgi:hypothetical protein
LTSEKNMLKFKLLYLMYSYNFSLTHKCRYPL